MIERLRTALPGVELDLEHAGEWGRWGGSEPYVAVAE